MTKKNYKINCKWTQGEFLKETSIVRWRDFPMKIIIALHNQNLLNSKFLEENNNQNEKTLKIEQDFLNTHFIFPFD